jgi:hypothetical protein
VAVGGTPPAAEVNRSGLPARSLAASTTAGKTHFHQPATQRQKIDIQTIAKGRKRPSESAFHASPVMPGALEETK